MLKIERYKSIDQMPIHCWHECWKGNFECVRDGVFFGSKGVESDFEHFNTLTSEYVSRYGWSQSYASRQFKLNIYRELVSRYTDIGDKFILNRTRQLEQELFNDDDKNSKGFDLYDEIVLLTKVSGINNIDPFKTTVSMYEAIKKSSNEQN